MSDDDKAERLGSDRALHLLIEEIDCACLIIEECSDRDGDTVCRSSGDDGVVYGALIHAGEYLVNLLREMEKQHAEG